MSDDDEAEWEDPGRYKRMRTMDDDDEENEGDEEENEHSDDNPCIDYEAKDGSDEEDETEESENDDDVDPVDNYVPPLPLSKADRKVCMMFSQSIIDAAITLNFEGEEIARMINLFIKSLGFDTTKTTTFLSELQLMNPVIIRILVDEGIDFNTGQILALIRGGAGNHERFLQLVSEAFEQHLFDVDDLHTIRLLCDSVSEMATRYIRRFIRVICEQARSKKQCGKIINIFLENVIMPDEAMNLIHELLSFDFFRDLRGKLEEFICCFPDIEAALRRLIISNFNLSKKGEIIESDEDEHGNLKGFVKEGSDNSIVDEDDDEVDDDDVNYLTGGNKKGIILVDESDSSSSYSEPQQERVKSSRKTVILDDDEDDDEDYDNNDNDAEANDELDNVEVLAYNAVMKAKKRK